MANNYRVPGTKMTSRFGFSNRQAREMVKAFPYAGEPSRRLKYAPRRLVKKCRHIHWVNEDHGGPESGYISGRCKDCGTSFYHQLY